MDEPESKEPAAPLDNPFGFNLFNALLLGIAAVVMLTLVILNAMGIVR
ncbi:MAG TPA: hypothetical protein VF278_10965 [Pirellulales bacterium]